MSTCEELKNYFEEVRGSKSSLVLEMEKAKQGGGYLEVNDLKAEILKKVEKIRDRLGTDKILLRDVIGKAKGYEFVGKFVDGIAKASADSKSFFIDENGNQLFGKKFDRARSFCEGLAMVDDINPDLVGPGVYFIDRSGSPIGKKELFYDANNFSEGVAAVEVEWGKWSFIYPDGSKLMAGAKFDYALNFSDGIALVGIYKEDVTGSVTTELEYFFLDRIGQQVGGGYYKDAHSFSEGVASVKFENKWHYVDLNGNPLLKMGEFAYADSFSEGLAQVSDWNGIYFINKLGKSIFKDENRRVSQAYNFSEGLAVVQDSSGVYFIDTAGEAKIEERFEEANSFSEGVAPVKKNGKWYFIDKLGKPINEEKFDYADSFSEGVAGVSIGKDVFYVDKSGRRLFTKK